MIRFNGFFQILLVFFCTILLAQKPVDVRGMKLRAIGDPELESIEIWVDKLVANHNFPSLKDYKLYLEIHSTEGLLLEGYHTSRYFVKLDTLAMFNPRNALFVVPLSDLVNYPGVQNAIASLYAMDVLGKEKIPIASATAVINLPKMDYVSWTINTVSVPNSESYDSRFIFSPHIACNADLCLRVSRSGALIHKSFHENNSCVLYNVQFRSYTTPKARWILSAMDFDNTSFDDRIHDFSIAIATEYGKSDREVKESGCELNYSMTRYKRPFINQYEYSLSSHEMKKEGVSGIAYSIKGRNVPKLISADFSLEHYAATLKLGKTTIVSQTNDSVTFFAPFLEMEPGISVIKSELFATFLNDLLATYSSARTHQVPSVIKDNRITEVKTSYDKMRGTMCLKISGRHEVPGYYVNGHTMYGSCTLEGAYSKPDSLAFTQTSSAFSFYIPLIRMEENRTSNAILIETFLFDEQRSPRSKRYFSPYADTLKGIKTELEDVTIRVFAKVKKSYAETSQWQVLETYDHTVLTEKKVSGAYTDLTIRKHKDDDLKLAFKIEGIQRVDEFLELPSVSQKKGKKIRLKSVYGAGKIRAMVM